MDVDVQSVSEITRQLKDLVEGNFPAVCVQGEISNCTRAGSGHVYLTLKDEGAQLRAVIWRSTAARLRFEIHDGLEVVAAGPIEIYAARGSYQLIVRELIPHGMGALELAFRQIQQKLAAEGLFDIERKRPLPRFPRRIALVTSPTGAAVRDMLQVITRRWPAVDIIILPVRVQGAGAAEEIAAALRLIGQLDRVDVVITGRGGGSLEDLWAFNEEVVARAIFECPVPVVSAVGHEIDVTIADLVADRRALTPSEAAELVVPHRGEAMSALKSLQSDLGTALRQRAVHARMQLDALAQRRAFVRPLQRIHDLAAQLDESEARMQRAIRRQIQNVRQRIAGYATSLEALSPLRVLQRGYTITRHRESDQIVRTTDDVRPGDEITTILHQGHITSRVESVEPNASAFGHRVSDELASGGRSLESSRREQDAESDGAGSP